MSGAYNNRRDNYMRTIRTKVYKFDELNEAAKQTALTKFWAINVDFGDWYYSVYDNAKNIGLEITSFDIDRQQIDGELNNSMTETCDKIIANHGEVCETYKTAQEYMSQLRAYNTIEDGDKAGDYEAEIEELESDFLKAILEDYLIILRKEYEYLTSEQAIKETIEANEYEFTKDGKQFNR